MSINEVNLDIVDKIKSYNYDECTERIKTIVDDKFKELLAYAYRSNSFYVVEYDNSYDNSGYLVKYEDSDEYEVSIDNVQFYDFFNIISMF